jgi:DnaJ-class molecular chaperone
MRFPRRSFAAVFFVILVATLFAGRGIGKLSVEKCLICHGKPEFRKVFVDGLVKDLYVTRESLKGSIHEKKDCSDCHFDVTEIPHRKRPKKVTCTHCHYKGNPEGAPQSDKYLEYFKSIHGQKLAKGDIKAPRCQDCHGAHDIKHAKDRQSHVSKENVAEVCGRCHMKVYGEFVSSLHGREVEKGNRDAPSCPDCHGEHNIYPPGDPKSTVYATHVPIQCSRCHGSVQIMSKYGISAEPVETYRESFHGVANQFGAKTVANCASCHGTHNIRPPEDPVSTVNPNNIPSTCGKCHPGANANFAEGKMHIDASKREAGVVYYVASFFKYLTLMTMLALLVHIFLDLYGRVRRLRGGE